MYAQTLKSVGYRFINLFFPRICVSCSRPLDPLNRDYLCFDCRGMIFWIAEPVCGVCGVPLEGKAGPSPLCSVCRQQRPLYRAARSIFRFEAGGRDLILRYKYGKGTFLAPVISRLLFERGGRWYDWKDYDLIIPVPLHHRKVRERGFDQSRLLAGGLGRLAGIRSLKRILRRRRYTPSQTRLSARERKRNIAGAFEVTDRKDLLGGSILLLDDVFTTGATVDECAQTLYRAGAARVDVLTAARAV